jgi:hypothetical protein
MIAAHKEMAKAVRNLAHRHSPHNVFSDFVEMAALSLSNAIDQTQFEKREARYMEIVPRYNKEELNEFPKLLGMLVDGLEQGHDDILGNLFHELELHNTYKGQFFTPYPVCKMMAMMTFNESAKDIIEQNGFLRASEPACGAGAMVIALADVMKADNVNYQQCLHVTAVDLDPRCVHMAYVQFSLLHIPAVVVHGNSLSLEEFGHWYTPAHIMGGWSWKLRGAALDNTEEASIRPELQEPENVPETPQPKPTTAMQLKLF